MKSHTLNNSITSESALRTMNIAPFSGQCDSLTGVRGGGNSEVVGGSSEKDKYLKVVGGGGDTGEYSKVVGGGGDIGKYLKVVGGGGDTGKYLKVVGGGGMNSITNTAHSQIN